MWARRAGKSALAVTILVLAALAWWRGACLLAGPDIDTDAYAHHMIARAILADPRDLSVHWVWLPLFHYIQVPLVALGGTMQAVRWANVVVASALPLVLFFYVRRTTTRAPDLTASFAAIVAAACPIAMQMSTTAQPEPLFALLVLFAAIAWQERHEGIAAALFSAAVLLRYEAWAAVAAVAATLFVQSWMPRRRQPPHVRSRRPWAVVAAPCALILVWALLRRPVDGRWFGFLGDTHQFAADATRAGAARRGAANLALDLLYYPLWVPLRVMGPVLPLVPFGVSRTVREQGARFTLVLAACLAFVSFSWAMRATLGLDRHFVVVVPLYATFAAQGLVAAADAGTRVARRGGVVRGAARVTGGLLGAASLGGLFVALYVWMGFWKGSIERGWPDRAAAGAFLRTLPPTSTVFCDEATLEILSGLDRHRIDRHWVDDPHTWDIVADVARARGEAYVATWSRKFRGHQDAGEVLFRAPTPDGDPTSGIEVMRVVRTLDRRERADDTPKVAPDGGRAAR
ncbi:MAG TPA: hypothetical protein VKU41_22325 [Polyangiaceae bacterium]|nr:hypothetical protein [Polyangiaceae bacterium]